MAAHRQLASLFAALERRRQAGSGSGGASGRGKPPKAGSKPRLRPSSRQSIASSASGEGREGGGEREVARSNSGASGGEAAAGGEAGDEGSIDGAWQRVGAHLATSLHVCMCVLLGTDVRQSATRAGVWRAQQCLQVRGRLAPALASQPPPPVPLHPAAGLGRRSSRGVADSS